MADQLIKHELGGMAYTPYYAEFEWAMDVTSQEVWAGLKEKTLDITCVTVEDPDYINPIRFPRYTLECESEEYRVKTFKVREVDYKAYFADLFTQYQQVEGMTTITLNFQKTAFVKDQDTIIQLNPWKELPILFILLDYYIAVQDGAARRFLMGHPMKKLPVSLLARHTRTYSSELSHLLQLILETGKAPDSNCFVLIDRYHDETLAPITLKETDWGITRDQIVGLRVSNGDTITVDEYERIQDYGVAAFRCHMVEITINGELLESLNPQLQRSPIPASCISTERMVRCIPYPSRETDDLRGNAVLLPAETVEFLPIHQIRDDFVILDQTIRYDSESGIVLNYR